MLSTCILVMWPMNWKGSWLLWIFLAQNGIKYWARPEMQKECVETKFVCWSYTSLKNGFPMYVSNNCFCFVFNSIEFIWISYTLLHYDVTQTVNIKSPVTPFESLVRIYIQLWTKWKIIRPPLRYVNLAVSCCSLLYISFDVFSKFLCRFEIVISFE